MNPIDLFKEQWIDEEQAIAMAMSLMECTREEALLALKEFREENPTLILREQ